MRRKDRKPFISGGGAMIGDVDAFHVLLQLVEIVAVELIEFDTLGHIVEVAADHVVVADYLMPVSQEGIGQMTAQKAGDAGDEDTLLPHNLTYLEGVWSEVVRRPSRRFRG